MVTATPASIILKQTETTCLSGHFCIIALNLVSNLESKGGARVTTCHMSRSHSICFFTLIIFECCTYRNRLKRRLR